MTAEIAHYQSDIYEKILNFSQLNKSSLTKKNYRYCLLDFCKYISSKKNISLPEDTNTHIKIIFNILLDQKPETFETNIANLKIKETETNIIRLSFINEVINYIEHLKSLNQAPRTIAGKIAALKHYINTLKAIGAINWDISVLKGPKIEKSNVKGPNEKIFGQLLKHVDSLWNTSDYINKRNALMFYILSFCGLRESEVTSIQIENINFEEKNFKTIKKGYTQLKITRIPDSTLEKIKLFLKEDGRTEGSLFIGKSEINPQKAEQINRSSFWRIIKKICSDCGHADLHPHAFRHFFVSEALEATDHNTRLAMKATGHKSERIFNEYEDKRKDDQGFIMNKIEQKWIG